GECPIAPPCRTVDACRLCCRGAGPATYHCRPSSQPRLGANAATGPGRVTLCFRDQPRAENSQGTVLARGNHRGGGPETGGMGDGPEVTLVLAGADLPPMQENLNREELIALALTRRGEMIQASTALCVTQLEVEAQRAGLPLPKMQTFASVADVHVQPVPQG